MNQISPPPAREAGDLHGFFLEDLHPGMSAAYARTVTEADVILFAGVSETRTRSSQSGIRGRDPLQGPHCPWMLTASFISTVLGNKLPGPGCIYVSQNLKFKAPVRAGDTVHTRVIVLDVDQIKGRVRLETLCRVGDVTVVEGEAVLMVPRRLSTAAE
jgi:3-hydroxybutyryl-CoA dehydratase